MINDEKIKFLFSKYPINERTMKHCEGVSKIAYEIALRIKKKNPIKRINPEKCRIAGLLHDIGKTKEGMHEFNTYEILQNEGLNDLAKISFHGFVYEYFKLKGKDNKDYLPKTIENKIVTLADMYYDQDEHRVTIKQRFDDIEKRYSNDVEFIKVVKLAKIRMLKLEKEIKKLY